MAKSPTSYSLRHREGVLPGLIRILNTMGRDARELSEKPESELEESIHGLRTLIKRLRAYLWFLRPALDKTLYAKSNSTLRKAAQRLSQARDLHAVASALTNAALPQADEEQLQALTRVSQAFGQQTAMAQKPDQSVHPLDEVADAVIQTLSRVVRVLKENANDGPSPDQRIKKAFKRTRRAMKESSRAKYPQLVHEWRKKTKRLFYILQLTVNLPKTDSSDHLKKVDELQEMLGNFQDSIVAEKHLLKRPPDVDADHIRQTLRLLQKSRKNLLKKARHLGTSVRRDI